MGKEWNARTLPRGGLRLRPGGNLQIQTKLTALENYADAQDATLPCPSSCASSANGKHPVLPPHLCLEHQQSGRTGPEDIESWSLTCGDMHHTRTMRQRETQSVGLLLTKVTGITCRKNRASHLRKQKKNSGAKTYKFQSGALVQGLVVLGSTSSCIPGLKATSQHLRPHGQLLTPCSRVRTSCWKTYFGHQSVVQRFPFVRGSFVHQLREVVCVLGQPVQPLRIASWQDAWQLGFGSRSPPPLCCFCESGPVPSQVLTQLCLLDTDAAPSTRRSRFVSHQIWFFTNSFRDNVAVLPLANFQIGVLETGTLRHWCRTFNSCLRLSLFCKKKNNKCPLKIADTGLKPPSPEPPF